MIQVSILCLLLSNAVTSRRDLSILFNRIAIIALILCILQDLISMSIIIKGIALHGGLLHITNIIQIFHIFIFLLSIAIIQLTSVYPTVFSISGGTLITNKNTSIFKSVYHITKIVNKMKKQIKLIEYPLILLFIITGGILLMSTNDLISIFLSIEFQSYGLYLLSTIHRNSELSTIGGLIYFLLGGLSSCLILLGTSFIYINSGITNLDSLYIITNISTINDIYF
jgi:NADH-ubiquinone oxidoreductase chain 2